MKKATLIGVVMLLVLIPALVQAQETKGDEVEIAVYETAVFALQYPGDWSVVPEMSGDESVLLSVPIAGTGSGGEGIVLEREDLRIWFTLAPNEKQTALEVAQSNAAEFVEGVPNAELTLALEFSINGNESAFVDTTSLFPQRFMAMVASDDTVVEVMLNGVPEQFVAAMPALMDVLNSFRLAGDDTPIEELDVVYALPETYNGPQWSFDHPAGWTMEDRDNFTLMSVPGIETTLGFSANHMANASDLEAQADWQVETVLGQAPGLPYEVMAFETNDYVAMRVDFADLDSEWGYTGIVAHPGDDILITVTIIGSRTEIYSLVPAIEDLIATVTLE